MISFLKGTVVGKDETTITVMTAGGVGYEVTMTPEHASKLQSGSEVEMPAYLKVSDTGMQLFGFQSNDERNFFQLLITVSGVGPKTAMHILSLGSLDNIQSAISRSD